MNLADIAASPRRLARFLGAGGLAQFVWGGLSHFLADGAGLFAQPRGFAGDDPDRLPLFVPGAGGGAGRFAQARRRAVPVAINVAIAVHIPAAFYVAIVVALDIAFARTTVGSVAVLILAARRFVKARLVKAWFLARFLARFLA